MFISTVYNVVSLGMNALREVLIMAVSVSSAFLVLWSTELSSVVIESSATEAKRWQSLTRYKESVWIKNRLIINSNRTAKQIVTRNFCLYCFIMVSSVFFFKESSDYTVLSWEIHWHSGLHIVFYSRLRFRVGSFPESSMLFLVQRC